MSFVNVYVNKFHAYTNQSIQNRHAAPAKLGWGFFLSLFSFFRSKHFTKQALFGSKPIVLSTTKTIDHSIDQMPVAKSALAVIRHEQSFATWDLYFEGTTRFVKFTKVWESHRRFRMDFTLETLCCAHHSIPTWWSPNLRILSATRFSPHGFWATLGCSTSRTVKISTYFRLFQLP